MKYNDIYRMYRSRMPESEIHDAFRYTNLDESDLASEGRTLLHLACQFGDAGAVRILLEQGADPGIRDPEGATALHILAKCIQEERDEEKIAEAAKLLIRKGANVSRSGRDSNALLEAAKRRHFRMVETILDSNVRIDTPDNNGENLLFALAFASGDIRNDIRKAEREIEEARLYQYPENRIEDIRKKIDSLEEEDGKAFSLIRRLVKEGRIDVEDKSASGKTAWDAAIEYRAMKIAALLAGFDPDIDKIAAIHGGMDIFQAMYCKNMAALDAVLLSRPDLQTVCEHKELVEFLGKSPLGCAFDWFSTIPEASVKLLEAGADPNYRYPDEGTAFATWISKDYSSKDTALYVEILRQMKKTGWNPELPADREGNAALALCCRNAGYRLAKIASDFLLGERANTNSTNNCGQTPLMLLYGAHPANGRCKPYGWPVNDAETLEFMEKLLEAGADTGRTDIWGNTLLHYMAPVCRNAAAQKAVGLLLDFSLPDTGAVNNDGLTAMDIASEYNNDNFVRLLVKYS